MKDPEIRRALLAQLRRDGVLRTRSTVVVEEVGLRKSNAIVDVAVVNGVLSGFEIKSDADTLRRLDGQIAIYSQIFDEVTLVVGKQHLSASRLLVPHWWGLTVVDGDVNSPHLKPIRGPKPNKTRDARALAELLWLDEARTLLERRHSLRGFATKPRDLVWDKLCEVYSLDEIAKEVRKQLKARARSGVLRRLS